MKTKPILDAIDAGYAKREAMVRASDPIDGIPIILFLALMISLYYIFLKHHFAPRPPARPSVDTGASRKPMELLPRHQHRHRCLEWLGKIHHRWPLRTLRARPSQSQFLCKLPPVQP